jgi:hypothetical protein
VAIISLTKTLAVTEGPQARVNAVAPGPIWTGLWSRTGGLADGFARLHNMPTEEAVHHEMSLRQLPLGRIDTPRGGSEGDCVPRIRSRVLCDSERLRRRWRKHHGSVMTIVSTALETVGFIGVGNISSPIARRLLTAGFTVDAYDRDPARAASLANDGAAIVPSVTGAVGIGGRQVVEIVKRRQIQTGEDVDALASD